jgi:hypothetical protein
VHSYVCNERRYARSTERSTYFLATAAHLHNCSSKSTQTISLEDRATAADRHFNCPLHGIVRLQQDRVRKHLITKHGRIRPQVICRRAHQEREGRHFLQVVSTSMLHTAWPPISSHTRKSPSLMTAGSFRYCPFCKKAKAALQQDLGSNFTVVEVTISFDRHLVCSRVYQGL